MYKKLFKPIDHLSNIFQIAMNVVVCSFIKQELAQTFVNKYFDFFVFNFI